MKPTFLKDIALQIGSIAESLNKASGVAVDTRLLRPGDLFFALPGAQRDGHSFIGAAANAGASGAVVHCDYKGPGFGLPLVYVPDVLKALQDFACAVLQVRKAAVVGVTGSLGKTTTKEFLFSLLRNKFRVSASPGNSNSQIGLPLTILNHTDEEDEFIILEMGMTESGQLSKLVKIAPPNIAIVTTVALVHAENFDSIEGIAQAKAEIFGHPETELGIYHAESDINHNLTKTGLCRKQSFSTTAAQSDFSLQVVKDRLKIREGDQTTIDLPLLNIPGSHNRHNFLAAAAAARGCGMDWEEIKSAQSTLELPERRMQIVKKQGVVFVNDAYNASEMSMKAALDSLPLPAPGGKRIAFFGGIVELGKYSEGCHRAVGRYALNHVDIMYCFGRDCLPIVEEWKSAGREVVWAEERSELTSLLRNSMQQGDVVLLKGSRSKGVCKVLEELGNIFG